MRVAECGLRAREITLESPDIADRVEPVGLRRRGVVGPELGGGALQLRFGAFPRPADGRDLAAVDAADAGEAG